MTSKEECSLRLLIDECRRFSEENKETTLSLAAACGQSYEEFVNGLVEPFKKDLKELQGKSNATQER